MTTEEQIARVLELSKAATPGPWDYDREWPGIWRRTSGGYMYSAYRPEDFEFSAACRTLGPLLARKLERAIRALSYAVDQEGDGAYLTCADTPFCAKGEPAEHSIVCMVRTAHDALADIEAMK